MIYFMTPPDGGPIKIGYTSDIKTRHYNLERYYGVPLSILATIEGGRDRESELHERFKHLRLGKTEQFRPAPELMTFIGCPILVGINPDTVEAMPSPLVVKAPTVRLTEEAIKWARIASGYTGESMAEYVSRITLERGREDAERLHAEATKIKPAAKKGGKEKP